MIEHLPTYTIHEYASAIEEGYFCPACREARLVDVPESTEVSCPHCGAVFASGWRRHVWGSTPPKALRGTPVSRLGSLFETIQAYAAAPRLSETVDETPLGHLADFVIDIDRESLVQASIDAEKVYAYLDALAPGQVRVYFSGSKGFHVIVPWQTLGAVPSSTLNQREYRFLAASVARATGVMPDYKLYSPGRMLRMPDTWHPKSGQYKVEVLGHEIEQAALLAVGPRGVLNATRPTLSPGMHDLYLLARERSEETERLTIRPRFDVPAFKDAPPCVQTVLRDGLPYKGSRHAVYLMLARYWLSAGMSPEDRGGFTGNKLTGGALLKGREYAIHDDPNTDTPQSVRVRDMEDTVKYVYRNEMRFSCSSPKSIGLCREECPLRIAEQYPATQALMNTGLIPA